MDQVQLLAAQLVRQVLSGRNLNQLLEESRSSPFTPQQRGLLQDLSYGTLRWLTRMEALLAQLLERPLTDERVRDLLLVALYQLEYSKNAPHAVVNSAVEAAARLKQPWAKGLVNAVLRNYLRQRPALLQNLPSDPATQHAWPRWWIKQLQTQYPQHWEAMLAAGNLHPPMTLRVNIRKLSREAYMAKLVDGNMEAEAVGEFGIRLAKPVNVDKIPGFFQGEVSVQDLGAQFAAPALDVSSGMRVLDACSAPGGKAAHLAELADIDLLALDHDAARLEKVRSNLQRLGLSATVKTGNAAEPQQWWDGRAFDRILADVPCTASGIVRRHPDIKWLRREDDIAGFCGQQAAILQGLWSTLAKGGKLLYATCSVFAQENQQQLAAFLASHPDARALPPPGLKEQQLIPCDQHDGFYYALLQKT